MTDIISVMDRYYAHYQRLGLRPGDSWGSLRRSYKSLIRRWHPDRFAGNESERCRAEEQTKEINRAYQELTAFFEEHGRLPLDGAPPAPTPTPSRPAAPPESAPSSAPRPTHEWSRPAASNASPGHGVRNSLALAAMLLIGAGALFWNPEQSPVEPTRDSPANPAAAAAGPLAPEAPTTSDGPATLAIGTTFGEVHAIQGTPTRVDGDTWYYGEAAVHFRGGRVASWTDSYPPRLKVQRDIEYAKPATPKPAVIFRYGSTKDEVRAIQGAPLREMSTVWDYGLSRVYFDRDGRVTHWHESPMDPLRVPH